MVRLGGLVAVVAVVAAGVSYGVAPWLRRDTTPTVTLGPIAQPGQPDGPQTAAQRASDSVARVVTGPIASPGADPPPAVAGGACACFDYLAVVVTAVARVDTAASV